MAAASNTPGETIQPNADSWAPQDESMGPAGGLEPSNRTTLSTDETRENPAREPENTAYSRTRGSSVGDVSVSGSKSEAYREKQVKPNKVYVGGLPEHTDVADLQRCFGKIGTIVNIELKIGYGFVEFDNREAAEESVAKYHEGFFMGNKIRVELSHGGGRTAKYTGDPGACFKCGEMGHWARECPNYTGVTSSAHRRPLEDPPLLDRISHARYDYAPPPSRDIRRPLSPREYRDYAPPPPPSSRGRDYDDYRRGPPVPERDRYPPAPPPEYRGRYPPPDPAYRGYGAPPAPAPAPYYDRYERRSVERYPPGYPAPGSRPRTPPRPPREEFERLPPPRDYDFRGRPPSPPPSRYADYSRVPGPEAPPSRYRANFNGYATRSREYPPRGGRDAVESVGYRRP
ncbi:hypothetical protein BD779DRAFT_1484182 [Infundibulicybe gibba]|nr:hypothetical protein BD779DRAFT_1484182 [Infundibulicybe gibba]